jgi:addiction module RelB/DinJ family antitoxin
VLTRDVYRIYFGYMKTVLNIKTDSEVKTRAQEVAQEIGLPLSTVVNAYLKEFIRDQSVRFSVEPQVRPKVGQMLARAHEDMKHKRNVVGPFKTGADMDRYLNRA